VDKTIAEMMAEIDMAILSEQLGMQCSPDSALAMSIL
jgi:hypothetical protein